MTDIKEWYNLKRALFGDALFVEPDFTDPRWVRYNELTKRVLAIAQAESGR